MHITKSHVLIYELARLFLKLSFYVFSYGVAVTSF